VKLGGRLVAAPNLGQGLVVGLNAGTSGWGNDSTGPRLAQVMQQGGTKWLREEFRWALVEPKPGSYDWSFYDHYMRLAAQAGVHVLPQLDYTPSWAGATWNTIPADPSAYAAFVGAFVNRYGPRGSFWTTNRSLAAYAMSTFEIWNEPYYDNGDNGNYNPAAYADLIKAAGTSAHNADPAAKILLAGETGTGHRQGDHWVNWIDALYQALPDLNNYFDGVAVHPYGSDLTGLSGTGDNQLRRVELIRSDFVSHGAADKPLWITEVGLPTCAGGSTMCATDAGQAAMLTQLRAYLQRTWKSYVKGVFVYDLQDQGTNPNNPEDNYGLYDYAGTAKPALAVFRALAADSALS
jgi:hypothetical protein